MGAAQGWMLLADEGVMAPTAAAGEGGREGAHGRTEPGQTEGPAPLLLPRAPQPLFGTEMQKLHERNGPRVLQPHAPTPHPGIAVVAAPPFTIALLPTNAFILFIPPLGCFQAPSPSCYSTSRARNAIFSPNFA